VVRRRSWHHGDPRCEGAYAEDGAKVYAKLDAERSILRDLTPDETFAYLEAIKRAKQRD